MSNIHDKPPPYSEFVNQPENAYSPPQPLFNPTGIPNYGSTVMVQPVSTQVIIVGGCPACRVGILEDDFTCLGYFLAIACFPIGLLCCYAMRQRRCPNCGAIFE